MKYALPYVLRPLLAASCSFLALSPSELHLLTQLQQFSGFLALELTQQYLYFRKLNFPDFTFLS